MVNWRWLLLLATALLAVSANAKQLSVRTQMASLEIGKYLKAEIHYVGKEVPGQADLQQWEDQWFVDRGTIDTESLPNGEQLTIEKLRLYPRLSGELLLESIALGGAIAAPQRIQVKSLNRYGIEAAPRWEAVPSQIWQGQSLEVSIAIELLHPSNHIAVEALEAPGFIVEPLPKITTKTATSKHIKLRWRLTAQQNGHLRLVAPTIEQRGRGRWRFYLPEQAIQVVPIPSYIPPTVPVGQIELKSTRLQRDEQTLWQLSISNHGGLPDEVHGLQRQLQKLGKVQRVSVETAQDGNQQSVQAYEITAPEWSFAFHGGPEVHIEYFDVDAGRLVTAATTFPPIWRLPLVGQIVLALLITALLTWLAAIGYRNWTRWQQQQSLRRSIRQAADANALRDALQDHARQHRLENWQSLFNISQAEKAVHKLDELCFSKTTQHDLPAVKTALLKQTALFRLSLKLKPEG